MFETKNYLIFVKLVFNFRLGIMNRTNGIMVDFELYYEMVTQPFLDLNHSDEFRDQNNNNNNNNRYLKRNDHSIGNHSANSSDNSDANCVDLAFENDEYNLFVFNRTAGTQIFKHYE